MKSQFTVVVTCRETVVSAQTLVVQAESKTDAEAICQEEWDTWRNGNSSDRIRIVEPEEIVESDYESVTLTVHPANA